MTEIAMDQAVLSLYPKKRIELPESYRTIYQEHYLSNRHGENATSSISKKLEGWMHSQVAADLRQDSNASTLEIGAGTLNQLPFEPIVGPYDIVEPFHALFENAPGRDRLRNIFDDISQAKNSGPYDRITNIAVFEHIADLPVVVAQSALLLKPEGSLRVAIPNEGTPMWYLGTCVSGYEFKKRYGLDYQVLMRYEHVNTAADIEGVLEVFFEKNSCKVLGLSKGLAFYRFYECRGPRVGAALEYLTKRAIAW